MSTPNEFEGAVAGIRKMPTVHDTYFEDESTLLVLVVNDGNNDLHQDAYAILDIIKEHGHVNSVYTDPGDEIQLEFYRDGQTNIEFKLAN